jgi:hypothetical protein
MAANGTAQGSYTVRLTLPTAHLGWLLDVASGVWCGLLQVRSVDVL